MGGLRAGVRRRRAVEHRRPAQHRLRVRAPDLVEHDHRVHRVPDARRRSPTTRPTASCSATSATSPTDFDLRRRASRSAPRSSRLDRPATAAGSSSATVRTAASSDATPGVIVANGTLSEPKVPTFAGSFDGEILHTSAYKCADRLRRQAGADHRRRQLRLRHRGRRRAPRGVGRHLACGAATTSCRSTSSASPPTPSTRASRCRRGSSRRSTRRVLKMFTGDPVRFGFPKPDYKIYESHPIVNSLVLHHLGHGDLRGPPGRRAPRRRRRACSSTAARTPYDLIVLATGYHLHYPFLDPELLDWTGRGMRAGPLPQRLHAGGPEPLRARHDRGVRASAGRAATSRPSWSRRTSRRATTAPDARRAPSRTGSQGPRPDLSGGYHYLGLERMSYYVNKDAYRARRARARSSGSSVHAVTAAATQLARWPPTSTTSTIDFNRASLTILKIVIGADPVRHRAGHQARGLRARALRRPVPIAIGVVAQFLLLPALTFLLTIAARRPRLGRARHDPGGLLPARERLQHPHPPRGRRRGAVGLDDRGQQPARDLPAADQPGLLGRALPRRQRRCSRPST